MLLWKLGCTRASESVFVFFGTIPGSGVSGLCGSPIFIFLRRLHTVFISGCTNLHPPAAPGVPFSPHARQRSLSAAAILTRVRRRLARFGCTFRWGLGMLSIVSCFFWHTQVFERMSTFILCPRWDRAVCCFDVEFVSSLYVLSINPLPHRLLSHAVGWLFILCKIFLVCLGSIP